MKCIPSVCMSDVDYLNYLDMKRGALAIEAVKSMRTRDGHTVCIIILPLPTATFYQPCDKFPNLVICVDDTHARMTATNQNHGSYSVYQKPDFALESESLMLFN